MISLEQLNTDSLQASIDSVCQRIAPCWPLDQMIAVSPYWHYIDKPFSDVASHLEKQAGSLMSMDGHYYLSCWQQGEITRTHLEQAIDDLESDWSVQSLIDSLSHQGSPLTSIPLLCDILDKHRDLTREPAWCDTITHQISQFCAAYFDDYQSEWKASRNQGLFSSWRQAMENDYSVALLMKTKQANLRAKKLPQDATTAIDFVLESLLPSKELQHDYLEACLLRIGGWASWCAYLNWQAGFKGETTPHLIDLLAIRVCWEWLVDDDARGVNSNWMEWNKDRNAHVANPGNKSHLLIWQRAQEISYQASLLATLNKSSLSQDKPVLPDVQAVFCIDVRSEVIRRHLELQSAQVSTLGFAGFFGLPISYNPIGSELSRPQLPGLLSPSMTVSETTGNALKDIKIVQHRQQTFASNRSWKPFKTQPGSSFTLVESTGLSYLYKLIKQALPAMTTSSASNPELKGEKEYAIPQLSAEIPVEQRVQLARDILQGMGLAKHQAKLVLLVGHGSQTRNNPQKAGLDCGACCGQSGEVNARAVAALLNETEVRVKLIESGFPLNPNSRFIAGLHNTTTEEIELLDIEGIPSEYIGALEELRQTIRSASAQARMERALTIGIDSHNLSDEKLQQLFTQRANNWAEVRPEWGLSNNAAFIIGPRCLSQHADLEGRVFMHEYDQQQDLKGEILEKIMTAPMLVTHWINMQYFASTVDNRRYGSGNKTLHNVVGGRIGLFEGNGGDLRNGLAMQSIHDGEQWRHQPLRLTVIIDAPKEWIESVINRHQVVRNLVENQWLYLIRYSESGSERLRQGGWVELQY